MRPRLQFADRISPRLAREKIIAFALEADHAHVDRVKSADHAFTLLAAAGYEERAIIEECRRYPSAVPLFQNLLPAGGYLAAGATERLVDPVTNQVVYEIVGPAITASPSYQALFEYACKARDRAVRETSVIEYQVSLIQGIASLEALLNRFALLWNHRNPTHPVAEDQHRLRIEEKIDEWLPIFTGGRRLDKSGSEWRDFQHLKQIRDAAVHPKLGTISISYDEMTSDLNRFRTGIAGLACELLNLVGWKVPAPFLAGRFVPEISVKRDDA